MLLFLFLPVPAVPGLYEFFVDITFVGSETASKAVGNMEKFVDEGSVLIFIRQVVKSLSDDLYDV